LIVGADEQGSDIRERCGAVLLILFCPRLPSRRIQTFAAGPDLSRLANLLRFAVILIRCCCAESLLG